MNDLMIHTGKSGIITLCLNVLMGVSGEKKPLLLKFY